jgi:hypothetical protein
MLPASIGMASPRKQFSAALAKARFTQPAPGDDLEVAIPSSIWHRKSWPLAVASVRMRV